MKVLLLSADTFEVTNENTGELIRGTTLFYLNDYREESVSSLGLKPTKLSGNFELFASIKNEGIPLPAMVELQIATKPGAGGKASLVATAANVIEQVELF